MPFLFYRNQAFTLVSHKPKQGVFYQTYSQKGFSRPFLLHNYQTPLYAATLDPEGILHVVSQTSKSQMTYFKIRDAQITKQIVLEDLKGIYSFGHLALHYLNGAIYLFYTALHPTENTRSLLCQILTQEPTVYTLLSNLTESPILQVISSDQRITILYLAQEQSYILRHITIDSTLGTEDLVTSPFPITAFNSCHNADSTHIVYAQEHFGKSQLIYVNPERNVPVLLKTSTALTHPCIFYYLGYIWITYMENQQLYGMLSMDKGLTFSTPALCSLQNNLDYYTFRSYAPHLLNGSSIYASVFNTLRLPIIANLDIAGIHPDIMPNTELELLLEGLKREALSSPSPPIPPIASPLAQPLPPMPSPIPLNLPPSTSDPSQKQSLRQATKAFMNQSHGFDVPPLRE